MTLIKPINRKIAQLLSILPLRVVLLASFVILITATAGVIGYLSFRNGQRAVTDVVAQLQKQMLRDVEAKLTDYFAMPHMLNRLNAAQLRAHPELQTDLEALRAEYLRQLRAFNSIETVAVGIEEQGNFVGVGRREGGVYASGLRDNDGFYRTSILNVQGQVTQIESEVPDYDARARPWYQTGAAAGQAAWSSIYVWAAKTDIGLTAVLPIYDERGALLGVQQSALTLGTIGDFLRELHVSQTSEMFLMERTGMLVASSTGEKPVRQDVENAEFVRFAAAESITPFVRRAAAHLIAQFGDLQQLPEHYQTRLEISGQSYFLHAASLRDAHGVDWILVIGMPSTDFMQGVDANVRNTVALSALAVLAAFAISVLMARWITRPILILNDSAKALAAGDWTQRVEIDRAGELGELAKSFNSMAQQLREAFDLLEYKVKLRTAELREKQAELREREEFLRTIYDNSEIAVFVVDVAAPGYYVYVGVNPMHERLFGMEAKWIAGRTPQELSERYDEELIDFVIKLYDDCAYSKQQVRVEHSAVVDGAERWWLSSIVPLLDQNGTVYRLIGTALEITDRKRAEDERALLFNLSMDMLCIAGFDGYFKQINPAWSATLGWADEEILSRPWLDFVHPDDRAATIQIGKQLMTGEPAYDFQNRYLCKDGNYRWISWNSFPLPEKKVIFTVARDITRQKQTEDALRHAKEAAEAANRAKSTFLANMSHELRTPLNAILGFTQLMQRDAQIPPEHQRNLATVGRSGEHLLALINDILALSKIEAGRAELQPENFDLYNMLLGLEEMFRLRAQQKGLSLTFNRAAHVPQYICADQGKLRQVLINLLGNAVKFTEKGSVTLRVDCRRQLHVGQVSLPAASFAGDDTSTDTAAMESRPTTLRRSPSPQWGEGRGEGAQSPSPQWGEGRGEGGIWLQFTVIDTGIGIAASELDQLFEPFVQTTSGLDTREGVGLGLSISYKLVQLMKGEMTVVSELGAGSSFYFSLPVEIVTAQDVQPAQLARRVIGLAAGQPHYRLLIVEDRAENRRVLVDLLRPLGFAVREAVDGQEAIELWEKWQPHLIWMDIRMPVLDGYAATRHIKTASQSESPIIIALTANAFEEERARALEIGCDDFLSKPFKEADIFALMSEHLGVQYVYEDTAPPPVSEPPARELTPEMLAALPAELLAELEYAAIRAHTDVIEKMVERVRKYDEDTADALARLAEGFDYGKIMAAIRGIGG